MYQGGKMNMCNIRWEKKHNTLHTYLQGGSLDFRIITKNIISNLKTDRRIKKYTESALFSFNLDGNGKSIKKEWP